LYGDAPIADDIELVGAFALSKQDLPLFDLARARALAQEFQDVFAVLGKKLMRRQVLGN
jgi:hypothetical protein